MVISTEFVLQTIFTLLIVIDPPGVLAPFLAMTSEFDKKEKKTIVRQAIGFSFIVLVSTIFVGQIILTALGISIYALRIAGGILLFKFGYETMAGTLNITSNPDESPGLVPLGFPIIAGPGSITATILLVQSVKSELEYTGHLAVIVISVIICLCFTFLFLWHADTITARVDEKSLNAIIKIIGLLIITIGIQLILTGLQIWFVEFIPIVTQ